MYLSVPHWQFSSSALLEGCKSVSGCGSGRMELQFKKSIVCKLEWKNRVIGRDTWKSKSSAAETAAEGNVGEGIFRSLCTGRGHWKDRSIKTDEPCKTQTSALPLITVLLAETELHCCLTRVPFVLTAKLTYLECSPFHEALWPAKLSVWFVIVILFFPLPLDVCIPTCKPGRGWQPCE